jgi:hypothetical protein
MTDFAGSRVKSARRPDVKARKSRPGKLLVDGIADDRMGEPVTI